MLYTFDEYVMDWWEDYIDCISETDAGSIVLNIFKPKKLITQEEFCQLKGELFKAWLLTNPDAATIYESMIDNGSEPLRKVLQTPDPLEFLEAMFTTCAGWYDEVEFKSYDSPSFAKEFVKDMARHAVEYDKPIEFFKDLSDHGCPNVIGKFAYMADCKRLYIEHMDDMEEYRAEIGERICLEEPRHQKHYVWICWLCYEELAHQIASTLFPDEF